MSAADGGPFLGAYSQVRLCKRGSLNVRFAPKATEILRCRDMTRMCNRVISRRNKKPSYSAVKTTVVSQFEISGVRFLYGPRFCGVCCASINAAISSMLHKVCVTPAAIAGVIRSVLCIRTKLYHVK